MMHRFHGVQGKLCRTGAASAMILLFAASASFAEIKGMPKLDATQPIGAATKPAASASEGNLAPPSFTTAQADRGRRAYIKECSDCHGAQLNDGEFGGAPLKGTYFQDHWGGMTVDVVGVASRRTVRRRWSLVADAGAGPFIPGIPAVAIARKGL